MRNHEYIRVLYINNEKQIHKYGATPDIQKALNYAVSNADLDTVKTFVEKGADVKFENSIALQCAAIIKSPTFGNLDIISYLVEQGADVNVIRHTAHPVVSKWIKENHPNKTIKKII